MSTSINALLDQIATLKAQRVALEIAEKEQAKRAKQVAILEKRNASKAVTASKHEDTQIQRIMNAGLLKELRKADKESTKTSKVNARNDIKVACNAVKVAKLQEIQTLRNMIKEIKLQMKTVGITPADLIAARPVVQA